MLRQFSSQLPQSSQQLFSQPVLAQPMFPQQLVSSQQFGQQAPPTSCQSSCCHSLQPFHHVHQLSTSQLATSTGFLRSQPIVAQPLLQPTAAYAQAVSAQHLQPVLAQAGSQQSTIPGQASQQMEASGQPPSTQSAALHSGESPIAAHPCLEEQPASPLTEQDNNSNSEVQLPSLPGFVQMDELLQNFESRFGTNDDGEVPVFDESEEEEARRLLRESAKAMAAEKLKKLEALHRAYPTAADILALLASRGLATDDLVRPGEDANQLPCEVILWRLLGEEADPSAERLLFQLEDATLRQGLLRTCIQDNFLELADFTLSKSYVVHGQKPVVQSFLRLMENNGHPALDGIGATAAFDLYDKLKSGVKDAFNPLLHIVKVFTPHDVASFLVLKRASSHDPVAKDALGLRSGGAST
eukprot:6172111-Pleurochrysis_carterae.AAC.1